MYKLIELCSQDFKEPSVRVVDDWSGKGLVKAAADSRISQFVSQLKPESDKIYLHILAMGAGEFYGANRNGDYFPEENLIEYHKTFETSPAHVFRNHVNKDPAKSIGKVIFAVYNERMHRVELIVWVDKVKGADIVQRLEDGDFPATSMAVKTPYDVCSICGNEAHTRQEYCDHLSDNIGRLYGDGRKVMAINSAPLRFFDISIVIRPADVTSSVLQKVASEGSDEEVVSSAELAERAGLTEKQASMKKLSEFVKEIESGNVVDYSDNLHDILAKVKDPIYGTIPSLANYELLDVLSTMAHLSISPSVGFLAELIGHKLSGTDAAGIGDLVEGYIGSEGVKDLINTDKSLGENGRPNPMIVDILMPSVKQASLVPDAVIDRTLSGPIVESQGVMFVPGTNMGYVHQGPKIEETPVEKFRRLSSSAQTGPHLFGMLKTLIAVGGAALAAKWYITNAIKQKMMEAENKSNNGVKIVLVKSASDYKTVYRLAETSMVSAIKKA